MAAYVTRARVHVDRIASAWAIRRFVDPLASFVFVDRTARLRGLDATPFDMRGARIGHRNGRCTFETLLEVYELADPALRRMAAIIRAADLPEVVEEAPPEAAGVRAIFDGLRDRDLTDEERLEQGFPVCDGLLAHCSGSGIASDRPGC